MADKGFGTYRKNKQGDVEYKSLKESEREAESKDKAERESPKRKIKDAANAVAKEFMFGVAPENKTDAFKKGGRVMKNEGMMEKKMGKGVAKADMQKVAGKAVKGHEKRMHGMKSGGMAKKYAKGGSIDGCATKGKTKGRMV